jgi:hypothetical protein
VLELAVSGLMLGSAAPHSCSNILAGPQPYAGWQAAAAVMQKASLGIYGSSVRDPRMDHAVCCTTLNTVLVSSQPSHAHDALPDHSAYLQCFEQHVSMHRVNCCQPGQQKHGAVVMPAGSGALIQAKVPTHKSYAAPVLQPVGCITKLHPFPALTSMKNPSIQCNASSHTAGPASGLA